MSRLDITREIKKLEKRVQIQTPEDRYVKIGGVNTRYWVAGDKGLPVVLVHGLGGSVENWIYNIGPLAQRHRVFALDLKGFGLTDKTPYLRDLNELVRFIRDFMSVQHLDKASLVGGSLGGGLVLALAVNYKNKVDKLVLVGNAGMGHEVIIDLRVASIPVIGELLSWHSRKCIARIWRKIVCDQTLVTEKLVEEIYRMTTLPGAHKALLATLRTGVGIRGQRTYLTRRLLDSVGGITAPTLVIWGRQDRIIPVAHAEIAAKAIPRARLIIFDRCGHMPQMEYPDRFNSLVMEFLAE